MTFFILCTVICHFSLLFILWFISFNSLVDFSIGVLCNICSLTIMPVTMRSQTKLRQLTGSTDGLSTLPSGRTGSTDGLS